MKAELAQQHRLLELAELDAESSRLTHRATHLPEQQRYEQLQADQRAAADRLAALAIAVEDLDAQVARWESEVDAVRRREDRDRGLLEGGSVNSKQLEELQHELETLQRRQASLEDTLLEVMERREQLGAEHAAQQTVVDQLDGEVAEAGQARDKVLGDVEQARAQHSARREDLVAGIEDALLGLYEKHRAAAGIGAARLLGRRCGACRIELDRGELARISAAPPEDVLQCPECRAILLRLSGSG